VIPAIPLPDSLALPAPTWLLWALLLLTFFLHVIPMMLLTRDTIRRITLELAGYQPVNWIAPPWGPIVIFVLLFVAAIGTVAWMTRALATARP
jgi:hypothetical protein